MGLAGLLPSPASSKAGFYKMGGSTTLKELALLFLRLGTTAFGGPAAHIAMMEDEVVKRRGWLDHQQFLDLLGATNLIPGPNSTEMAIHIGLARAGWKGVNVASLGLTAAVTWQLGRAALIEIGSRSRSLCFRPCLSFTLKSTLSGW